MIGVDYASVDGNHPPDFVAARAAGVRFAIVRASYSILPDPTCARDRNAIRAAGLTFGAYLFPVMDKTAPDPEVQVHAAVASAGLISGRDLPLALDIEFPHGVLATGRTRAELGVWIARAIAAVRKETGVDPIVYSSQRVLDGADVDALAGAADITGCPLWLARYPFRTLIPAVLSAQIAAPPVPRAAGDQDDWWCHQYQGDAIKVPGFGSTVDLSRWNPLRKGSRGARVRWARRRLRLEDGAEWDDAMDHVVREWQTARGLEPDGVIGPATFAALAS